MDDAIATLSAYLVPCFPKITIGDLESILNPTSGEYIVKEKGTGDNTFGVWIVQRSDGIISPENNEARANNIRVTRGC